MESGSADLPLDLSTKKPSSSTFLSGNASEIVQLLTKDKVKPFPCVHCNIGFTSATTLLVHQKYYCAKTAVVEKPPIPDHKDLNKVKDRSSSVTTVETSSDSRCIAGDPSESSEDDDVKCLTVGEGSHSANQSREAEKNPAITSSKTAGSHFCPDCAFRANTVRGLRSHFKCHSRDGSGKVKVQRTRTGSRSPGRAAFKRPKIDGVLPNPLANATFPEKKKFCKYCDISFKYLSTFLAHRKYYCTVRKIETVATTGVATS